MHKAIIRLLIITGAFLITSFRIAEGGGFPKKYPWAGGLNAAQFSNIDLNLDGKNDILIFDRHGNRLLPFINKSNVTGEAEYEFHPEYSPCFPDLHDWIIIRDYNNDGKADIFTYGLGGARVFKNISSDTLEFKLEKNLLTSWYYNGEIGILITNVDYPAIEDLDGDGDLDLLTFFGLGSYVEYHRNMSVENFGNSDSLKYRLWNKCWGDFREGLESNKIELNVVCPYKNLQVPETCSDGSRHTGSTMYTGDLNGDSLPDLILGDVDYPLLISLINGGTADSAHMISEDSIFPFVTKPVRLFSFPVCSSFDYNNDGLNDMAVSVFDPSLTNSENFSSCLFYENAGSNGNPVFTFRNDRFFQDQMLDFGSGAYPVFTDIDRDGLKDLLVGNYGYYDSSWYDNGFLYSSYTSGIAYLRNTGTADMPEFSLITDDLAGLSSQKAKGLYPSAADINGDGFPDIIAGKEDGTLIYLENKGLSGDIPEFNPPVVKYAGIDIGEFSAPQLFDLDRDGLNDLIIGEKKGNLNYCRNTGTAAAPVFSFITDSLGKINVTNYNLSYDGYSTPCFFRENDQTFLICGSEEGKLWYYGNIDGNLTGRFSEKDSLEMIICPEKKILKNGIRISPAIAHVSGSVLNDLVIGNYCGGLNYLSCYDSPRVLTTISDQGSEAAPVFRINPNPADREVTVLSPDNNNYVMILRDISGRSIISMEINGKATLRTSELTNGLYLLQFSPLSDNQASKSLVYRIIINHSQR